MGLSREKVARQGGPGYRRFVKACCVRWMRRLGKRLLDDAPLKLTFKGWAD